MRRFSSLIPVLGILIVALVLGGLVGWWASRGPEKRPARPQIAEKPTEQTPTESTANVATTAVKPVSKAQPVIEQPVEPVPVYNPPEAPTTAANWEEKLDDVLGNDKMDFPEKSDKLADMITTPGLPEPAQKDLAEHLINLVADQDFYKKAARIMLDEKMPKDVSQVLFDDLMNRDEGLRLPLILRIAKNENHPLNKEAREALEMNLQEEFGTDWEKWQNAIDESLKSQGLQPDPNLATLDEPAKKHNETTQ